MPAATFSPAAGVDEMILPTWLLSEVFCSVCGPRTSPRSISSGPASTTVLPVRGGTAAWSGPLPTCSVTVVRSATSVFAGGSVPTTRPFSSTDDVTGVIVARRFAACNAARAASGCWPDTFGTATCRTDGDPPKIRYPVSARSPTTTAAAMPIAIRRPRRRSGSSSYSP